MKRYIRVLLLPVLFMFVLSCNRLLDVEPLDQITSKAVWNDPSLMEAYVNNMYIGLGLGEFNSTSGLGDLTDEAMWTNGGHLFGLSNITPDNMGIIGGSRFDYLNWDDNYSYIRKCNVFLKNTKDTSSFEGEDRELIKRLRGETYFLRGYFYHNLLRTFGGVPIITHVYGLHDSTAVPRNSFEETVNFIVRNADSAAALLPLSFSGDNIGRATKGAAMALKSRVLLYAASDLYDINPSGMSETGYESSSNTDRRSRWRIAKDAAKAVMDLGIYHLYNKFPDSAAENYANVFLDKVDNPEIIFCRFTSAQNGAPNVGRWFSPNGYDGWGEESPLQQMVDAYEMKDGSAFSWNNPVHAANPYENRDPRFYASIFYDGATWRKRYSDVAKFDPVGIVQTFKEITLPDGSTLPGIDTRHGPVQNWNGSYTGYYCRKFLDPTNDQLAIAQEVPWIFFRYAEILLNYAEAAIELGEYQDARVVLNKIRERAGMPGFEPSLTGDQLMREYRNERQVEMAFEQQRFFDMRRWMIAPEVMNENAKGIEIFVKGTDRADRSTYHDYEYNVIDVRDREWKDKMYFMPIPFDEMQRNPKLKQNPGY